MTRYTYGPLPVFSAGGNGLPDDVMENQTGGIFSATLNGPALPVFDFNDQPLAGISSSATGQAQWRADDVLTGFVRFGSVSVAVAANDVPLLAQRAAAAEANAASAASAAAASQAEVQRLLAAFASTGGGSVGGGNLYLCHGTTSPRVDESTGGAIPAGKFAAWIADTEPTNLGPDDVWLNYPV